MVIIYIPVFLFEKFHDKTIYIFRMYIAHRRYFISNSTFDLIPLSTLVHENELNQRIAILKNLILSILTIMFYSVYEYTARLNVTNGTVNLTGELIKNLECETRVSRVVLWCICNG